MPLFAKGQKPPAKGTKFPTPTHIVERREAEQSDAVIRKAKWAAMKEEFIELSITGKDIHWPTLAGKYGFQPQTARNRASTQKWYGEIETRRKEREDLLETKLAERTHLALDKLNEDFATSEAQIRKRHALMARGLQVKAIEAIKGMKPSELSPKDAIAMLRLGMEEERFAMGMKETADPDNAVKGHTEYNPVVEQMGGHKRIQGIAGVLLKALQSQDVEDILAKPMETPDAAPRGEGPGTPPSTGYAPPTGPVLDANDPVQVIAPVTPSGPKKIVIKKVAQA